MAAASLLALLDDITTVLDDIALLTKVAAKKTAGVLGDDLALNAQQVAGVQADRELPVVWAVAKGSFKNKLILVPAALGISAIAPWLITPLLMIGGAYLCYEGFEKIAHSLLHNAEDDAEQVKLLEAAHNPNIDMVALEQEKIKGAIRTDFVLSAEIIVIALGTVKDADFMTQVLVVSMIGLVMTIGVYGLVAGIVKLDDLGFHLLRDPNTDNRLNNIKRSIGKSLLMAAPYLMKTLSIVGTAAMFMVGGGILLHGLPHAHEWLEHAEQFVQQLGWMGHLLGELINPLVGTLVGLAAGGLILAASKKLSGFLDKNKSTAT